MRKVLKKQKINEKKRNSIKVSKFDKHNKRIKHCKLVSNMLTKSNNKNEFKNNKLETLFSFLNLKDKLYTRLVCKYWNDFIKNSLTFLQNDNFLYINKRNQILINSTDENKIFQDSETKKFSKKSLLARYINSNNVTNMRNRVNLGNLTKLRNFDYYKEN